MHRNPDIHPTSQSKQTSETLFTTPISSLSCPYACCPMAPPPSGNSSTLTGLLPRNLASRHGRLHCLSTTQSAKGSTHKSTKPARGRQHFKIHKMVRGVSKKGRAWDVRFLLVLLVLSDQILDVALRLGELHLVHPLVAVPVQKRPPLEHGGKLVQRALPHFLDGSLCHARPRQGCKSAKRKGGRAAGREMAKTHRVGETHSCVFLPYGRDAAHGNRHIVWDPAKTK